MFVLGTQATNPSIGHMATHVNYQKPSHNLLHQLYQVKQYVTYFNIPNVV
jgi:hypothetical protein